MRPVIALGGCDRQDKVKRPEARQGLVQPEVPAGVLSKLGELYKPVSHDAGQLQNSSYVERPFVLAVRTPPGLGETTAPV